MKYSSHFGKLISFAMVSIESYKNCDKCDVSFADGCDVI